MPRAADELGRVDGLNRCEADRERWEGGEVGLGLLAEVRDAPEPFELAHGLLQAGASAAAQALGCEGVNIGARFLATKETLTQRPFRSLRNTTWVDRKAPAVGGTGIEAAGGAFEDVRPCVARAALRAASRTGDIAAGMVAEGKSVAPVNDVPSCAKLAARSVAGAKAIIHDRSVGMAGWRISAPA